MTASPDPSTTVYRRLRDLGPMRLVLLGTALVLLLLTPEPGTRAVLSGWALVTSVLVPVLAPLVFMVLLLDALMARVFLTDAEGAARDRYKRVVAANLLAAAVLLLRWLPYYAALRV